MQQVPIRLGASDEEFDLYLFGRDGVPTLKDGGDLTIVTKDDGTVDTHRGIACLFFTVELPGGGTARAQTVTTVRILKMALAALEGRYDDDGRLREIGRAHV